MTDTGFETTDRQPPWDREIDLLIAGARAGWGDGGAGRVA